LDQRETVIKRWADGKSWSASRVSGSFLIYREMEGKGYGSYKFKSDGIMKKSFSIITSNGEHYHLISYYSGSDFKSLPQPSKDAQLKHINIVKDTVRDNYKLHNSQLVLEKMHPPFPTGTS
jgi:hypothetical protein